MARHTHQGSPLPKWKTKWPRNGALKTWFRVMIEKCDAIPNSDTAAEKAHLPIEHLAEMGHVTEALRHVNRFLRRLPRANVLSTVRMAKLGAKICLEADDLARMEKYFAIAEATEQFNTRRCDEGFSSNSVRQFRADHGLLDPSEAIDEKQRIEARFYRAWRQYQQAKAKGEQASAQHAVVEMEKTALEVKEDWLRQSYFQRVIDGYAELKDVQAVMRCVRKLDKDDRHEILDAEMLARLGMKTEAITRACQDIAECLKGLRESNDPNIHFPVMSIRRSLSFLVEHGEKDEARLWLHRALRDIPTWPVIEYGIFTSSVYHSLAEAMVMIEGPVAAEKLLEQAMTDAKLEKRGASRKAAVDDVLEFKANIGMLDEAIEDARRLRSPTQRRKTLGKLLAKAKRWKELREVLSQVASPEEAADVAWWIKFELPGGEAR